MSGPAPVTDRSTDRRPGDGDPAAMLAPLWRGLVVFRVVALGVAVVNAVRYADVYAHPVVGAVVLALMAVWTVVTAVAYLRGTARRLAPVDLAVTVAATLSTLVVVAPDVGVRGLPLLTTIWAAGAVLAVAVAHGWRGGLLAGAVSAATLGAVRQVVDPDLLYDVELLVIVGAVVGFAADTLRRSARRLQAAIATEAATAERERLARDIHDGVLQVLAVVRRRGIELGERGTELARLAGEQEVSLRRLITTGPAPAAVPGAGPVDLRPVLAGVLPPHASLALPADPVLDRPETAAGLAAVVREAVSNAERHAPGSGLWVLLEDTDDAVTVTVRDDGPGIDDGRLAAAEADGHLGVASSIRGRVRELGGTTTLVTAPGAGVEWEVRVPRARPEGERA